jgi:hypothetical protein
MTDHEACQILQALVNGMHPFTQGELAPGTVGQHVDVMRAMLVGCAALKAQASRTGRRKEQSACIGKAWTPEEEEQLLRAFRRGEYLERIAARHGRALRAIESRLEMLGVIASDQRRTGWRTTGQRSSDERTSDQRMADSRANGKSVESSPRAKRAVSPRRARRNALPELEGLGANGQTHASALLGASPPDST